MTSLPVTCLRRTRPQNFHDPFPRVAYRPHTYIVFVLSQLLLCLSELAGINQHKGEIVPDRYRWDSYGTLLVKVLYRAPSLITHTILRTDLMHEGPHPRTSVSP